MRNRRLCRLYWTACGLLTLIGVAGLVGVFVFPPEQFDAEGNLIGEMPPAFGGALFLALTGMVGLLGGSVVAGMRRWFAHRRPHRR